MTVEEKAQYVASLIRERDMAGKRGDRDEVAAVNAELNRVQGSPPAKRAQKRRG